MEMLSVIVNGFTCVMIVASAIITYKRMNLVQEKTEDLWLKIEVLRHIQLTLMNELKITDQVEKASKASAEAMVGL